MEFWFRFMCFELISMIFELIFVYTNLKVYHFLIKKCTTPNRLRRYA